MKPPMTEMAGSDPSAAPRPPCPSCSSSKDIIRSGRRKGIQQYLCKACKRSFIYKTLPNASYPPRIILSAISTYNLGHTLENTTKIINRRFKTRLPITTLHSWLNRYKHICTFLPLRRKYSIDPEEIILSKRFHHQQVYEYKFHKLKLNIAGKQFPDLKDYLTSLLSGPRLGDNMFMEGTRCSDFPGRLNLPTPRLKKSANNNATKMARFGLELARTNHERHQAIEDFFLINDFATIASEVPVFLTPKEAKSFNISIPRTLTGHIDMIQVRNNKIHILDYKPDREGNVVNQLLLYAKCLKKRTGISNIVCAYFDENEYFQFISI